MKALVLTQYGGPENFELREVPDPAPGPGEVLVRVAAVGVNPVDYKLRAGGPISPELPAILGQDLAGTVEAVGDGVAGFREGDEVYGCPGGLVGMPGTMAELKVADARVLAPKPEGLSMREAAALPLVSITAWEGLIDRMGIGERGRDRRVLVYGGTGGVGHVGVQIAKAQGAWVATTASSGDKAKLARDLGADEVIDYRSESPEEYVERLTGGAGFEAVFDAVGADNLEQAIAAAGLNAEVASIVTRQSYDLGDAMSKGLTIHIVFMLIPLLHDRGRAHHGEILRGVNELVAAGKLRPLLDERRFTLEEGAEAHRYLEGGEAVGKVVLEVE